MNWRKITESIKTFHFWTQTSDWTLFSLDFLISNLNLIWILGLRMFNLRCLQHHGPQEHSPPTGGDGTVICRQTFHTEPCQPLHVILEAVYLVAKAWVSKCETEEQEKGQSECLPELRKFTKQCFVTSKGAAYLELFTATAAEKTGLFSLSPPPEARSTFHLFQQNLSSSSSHFLLWPLSMTRSPCVAINTHFHELSRSLISPRVMPNRTTMKSFKRPSGTR